MVRGFLEGSTVFPEEPGETGPGPREGIVWTSRSVPPVRELKGGVCPVIVETKWGPGLVPRVSLPRVHLPVKPFPAVPTLPDTSLYLFLTRSLGFTSFLFVRRTNDLYPGTLMTGLGWTPDKTYHLSCPETRVQERDSEESPCQDLLREFEGLGVKETDISPLLL